MQSTRVDLIGALKRDTRRRTPLQLAFVARVSPSQVLVVSQIAVSLLLLVAAGLFVRTLANLNSIALGFDGERVLLFAVNAKQAGYKKGRVWLVSTKTCRRGCTRSLAYAVSVRRNGRCYPAGRVPRVSSFQALLGRVPAPRSWRLDRTSLAPCRFPSSWAARSINVTSVAARPSRWSTKSLPKPISRTTIPSAVASDSVRSARRRRSRSSAFPETRDIGL